MKKTLPAILLASICCGTLAAEEVVEIDGDIFHIASSESTDEATTKEFVPAGETIKDWSTMVTVRHFKKQHGPRIYIENLAKAYRMSMPHMGFATSRVGSAQAWDIDFIMYDRSKRTDGYVEWNYLRAERRKFGEGIFVNQYVKRWRYSRSIDEVFGSRGFAVVQGGDGTGPQAGRISHRERRTGRGRRASRGRRARRGRRTGRG